MSGVALPNRKRSPENFASIAFQVILAVCLSGEPLFVVFGAACIATVRKHPAR